MQLLMFVIGHQAILIPPVQPHMVLTVVFHQLIFQLKPILTVDPLTHMDARNAQQRNVRNAAIITTTKAMVKAIVNPLQLFLKYLWVSSLNFTQL